MTALARRPRLRAMGRLVLLIFAIALTTWGVCLIAFSDTMRGTRLGIPLAFWGALLGYTAIRVSGEKTAVPNPDVLTAPSSALELRASAELVRERDEATRHEYELRLELMLRRELEQVLRTELTGLRRDVAELRGDVLDAVDGRLRMERVEITRIIGSNLAALQDDGRISVRTAAADVTLAGPGSDHRAVRDDVSPARAVLGIDARAPLDDDAVRSALAVAGAGTAGERGPWPGSGSVRDGLLEPGTGTPGGSPASAAPAPESASASPPAPGSMSPSPAAWPAPAAMPTPPATAATSAPSATAAAPVSSAIPATAAAQPPSAAAPAREATSAPAAPALASAVEPSTVPAALSPATSTAREATSALVARPPAAPATRAWESAAAVAPQPPEPPADWSPPRVNGLDGPGFRPQSLSGVTSRRAGWLPVSPPTPVPGTASVTDPSPNVEAEPLTESAQTPPRAAPSDPSVDREPSTARSSDPFASLPRLSAFRLPDLPAGVSLTEPERVEPEPAATEASDPEPVAPAATNVYVGRRRHAAANDNDGANDDADNEVDDEPAGPPSGRHDAGPGTGTVSSRVRTAGSGPSARPVDHRR